MKRWICFLLMAVLLSIHSSAVELPKELRRSLPRSAETLLRDVEFDIEEDLFQSLFHIWENASAQMRKIAHRRIQGATAVLAAVLLCAAARGLHSQEDRAWELMVSVTGSLSVTLLTVSSLHDLMGLGLEVIQSMNLFSKALIPTLAAACAASGGLMGAGVRQAATIFFVDIFLNLTEELLIPLIYLYVAALTAAACLPDGILSPIAGFLKKGITWILTGMLLLFTAYLSVSNIFSGVVDETAVKVAKATVSGVVPVVGGIIAEATETILAGAGVLRGTIGLFGVLGIIAVCLVPFFQLALQFLLYKAVGFLSLAFGAADLSKLIEGLGAAFGLILGTAGSCALLLLISILTAVSMVVP